MAFTDRINPNIALGRLLHNTGGIELKYPSAPQSKIPLPQKSETLLKYLREEGYTDSFIKKMKCCYSKIVISNASRDLVKYNELICKDRPNIASYERWIAYDFYDVLPGGAKLLMTDYDKLNPIHREFVDVGIKTALKCGLRESSINTEASNVSTFLLYLQDNGVDNITKVAERTVQKYVSEKHCQTMILYRIGLFIRRHAIATDDTTLKSILPFFPTEKVMGKVYEAFTKDERTKLEAFITRKDCPLSKRNRAITALMLYTGMRAKDMRDLKLSDIDWAKSQIKFRQGKTGVDVLLPLRPFAGNCLYDYIRNERRKGDDTLCFLSGQMKGNAYCGCNIHSVINGVYKQVGIRQGNMRKGSHLLRHSLADEMINQGADVSIVAKTLGHLHPNTTLGYLSANIEQLRSCALSIECFPVNHKLY